MHELAAVSGATGFIGSAVVRRLLADGRRVRALIEPQANTRNLDDLPAENLERVTVDVCDLAGMRRALEGAGAYYHLAAIYKLWTKDPSIIYRVNIEGTTTSLLAARDAGVGRVVYTSSIAAVGRRTDGSPSDESVGWNLFDVANDYILTKYLSERIALRFADAGAPIVVVNPAFPFGPRDIAPTPTGGIILSVLRGQVPGIGEGGFCAVDVDDVAAGHVAAETRGRIGERYILGNHNVTFREFIELVCDVAGLKAPTIPIPRLVGQGIALGMQLWSEVVSGSEPLTTLKSIKYLQNAPWFDATKARRELDLPSTPLRVSVERAVDYFRAHNMV
ncbi:MAG TPA: NAD-dependent epimerase/dehydratase family protein [Polyangiaceae bacterium]|nr:NAD-dependent epimerase/dehydratase family protein [Polyangiaceae bacterium]